VDDRPARLQWLEMWGARLRRSASHGVESYFLHLEAVLRSRISESSEQHIGAAVNSVP
jgi:hypothetical protein